jgi:hypothetical protein
MAQTGFTPIQLYSSSTATNVPLAANLATGELAINITDGKLFYKDNAAAVQVIGWKVVPATAGGTGQTSYAIGDLLYANTTTTLAKLPDVATGNALISGGVSTAPSWGKIGLTTHVSGTLPVANGGTNLTSFTSGGVVYASSASALATSSSLIFDGANLGLVTPSAWGSGFKAFENQGGALYSGSTSANLISQNFYFDGTNNVYKNTGFATAYSQNSGVHYWYTAPSGTAGNTVTFTERLNVSTTGIAVTGAITATSIKFGSGTVLSTYEQGTWTPTAGSGLTVTGTFVSSGTYRKIGRLVTVNFTISATLLVCSNATQLIAGLPFSHATDSIGSNGVLVNSVPNTMYGLNVYGSAVVLVNANLSTTQAYGSFTYPT